jgi:hypothetical protein
VNADYKAIEARTMAWLAHPVYHLPHLPAGSWWHQCRLFRIKAVPDFWPYGPTARWAENSYFIFDDAAPIPAVMWESVQDSRTR